ncbi:MAG TPA: phospholipase D-like domain-containing protein [Mucilaginibacter sp.]
MKPNLSVYANSNETLIAWNYANPIDNCIGFAIYKKLKGETDAMAQPLNNRVGFADETYTLGQEKPSTEWPFQRLVWSDYTVKAGDKVQYMIVPILINNGQLVKDASNVSDWSDEVTVATGTKYQAYFNRGLVASQFFSRTNTNINSAVSKAAAKSPIKSKSKNPYSDAFKKVIDGGPSELRDFLGGDLYLGLTGLLKAVKDNKNLSLYAALYELKLDDFTDALSDLGKQVNLILANGTGKSPKGENADKKDENILARKKLDGKINLYDRMVNTKTRFAHNKFVVICDNDQPVKVLTGTTNWTPDGVFAQVNNSILIDDAVLAGAYLEEWKELKASGDDSPDDLYNLNESAKVSGDNLRAWCNPLKGLKDLTDIESLMDKAQNGILFLMFNPGPKNTVFNKVLDLLQNRPELFIHGVMNQDPGKVKGSNPLIFFDQNGQKGTDWDVALPDHIDPQFAFWYTDPSDGLVTIHSKSIVIDPFGDNPIAITGSNNLGPKASGKNDDNFVIVNDAALAKEYAVNIMSVYAHYRWRYSVANKKTNFKGLTKDPKWMQGYMSPSMEKQMKFLLL